MPRLHARTFVSKRRRTGDSAPSGVWWRVLFEKTRNDMLTRIVSTINTSRHSSHHKASHVQTKRFFAAIEVVSQISMACIQAVGLVRDRQAIDLKGDLGPASKSMGLSGQFSPRSEQRQSFACSPCAASTDRRQACAHGRQIRIALSPLRGRSSLLMPSKP